MTIKEIKDLVSQIEDKEYKGVTEEEKAKALEGYQLTKNSKSSLADLESRCKAVLTNSMSAGEQLSLDLGSYELTSSAVELDEISFDISDEDLYLLCLDAANGYCKHSVDKTLLKKDYKKGLLPSDVSSHVVITKQGSIKITKKEKKGGASNV